MRLMMMGSPRLKNKDDEETNNQSRGGKKSDVQQQIMWNAGGQFSGKKEEWKSLTANLESTQRRLKEITKTSDGALGSQAQGALLSIQRVRDNMQNLFGLHDYGAPAAGNEIWISLDISDKKIAEEVARSLIVPAPRADHVDGIRIAQVPPNPTDFTPAKYYIVIKLDPQCNLTPQQDAELSLNVRPYLKTDVKKQIKEKNLTMQKSEEEDKFTPKFTEAAASSTYVAPRLVKKKKTIDFGDMKPVQERPDTPADATAVTPKKILPISEETQKQYPLPEIEYQPTRHFFRQGSRNDIYTARPITKEDIELEKERAMQIEAQRSLDMFGEQVARTLLPVDSIENLILKYKNNQPVGFWDWAWVVADVGLTVAEVKIAYKTIKIAANSKYFFKTEVRQAIDAQIEKEFAGDAARTFAAKRYWRRKFLTEPGKMTAATADGFIEKAVEFGTKGGLKYETGRAVVKGTSAVTRASGWQYTKNIIFATQAAFMTGITLYSIERGTELLLSPTLPKWVVEEHPNWEGQMLTQEEMRELAIKENRMGMAAIWGVFETLGLSAKAVQALAPKIKSLLNKGTEMSLEGKDPTEFFQKNLPKLLEEAGLEQVPTTLEKPLVNPFVKIVKAMARGAKIAAKNTKKYGKILLATPEGEMGVADTAFLTYYMLNSENVLNAQNERVQDDVVRKATEHVYEPYLEITALDEHGKPIIDQNEAEKEIRQNLEKKFTHLSPDNRTAFLNVFVQSALAIDMENPDIVRRVTQGTETESAIPPQRFNRFVLLEQELEIIRPIDNTEKGGTFDKLERLLAEHYQPEALNALYDTYKGRALDLWLDVEDMASRWLNSPETMERELPAGIRETFKSKWRQFVLSPPPENKKQTLPQTAEDRQMMAAMELVLSHVLWGYLQPQAH